MQFEERLLLKVDTIIIIVIAGTLTFQSCIPSHTLKRTSPLTPSPEAIATSAKGQISVCRRRRIVVEGSIIEWSVIEWPIIVKVVITRRTKESRLDIIGISLLIIGIDLSTSNNSLHQRTSFLPAE